MPRRLLFSLFALAVLAASCARDESPVAPPPPVIPTGAYSPVEAVRLVEWAWKNRNCEVLDRILTEDYRFQFAYGDSSGQGYLDVPFTFEDELRTSLGIFVGTPEHLPANEILVDFDRTLVALNDDRPGRDPRWHRSIRTSVNLNVTLSLGSSLDLNTVHGYAKFYAVRGDSAVLSPAQVAAGGRDSTRWWIDRWEDETLPWGGSSAHPTAITTWGRIKVLFR